MSDSEDGMYDKKAQTRYQKEGRRKFTLNYARATDGQVIEKLESVPSVNGYVRELVLRDIGKKDS